MTTTMKCLETGVKEKEGLTGLPEEIKARKEDKILREYIAPNLEEARKGVLTDLLWGLESKIPDVFQKAISMLSNYVDWADVYLPETDKLRQDLNFLKKFYTEN